MDNVSNNVSFCSPPCHRAWLIYIVNLYALHVDVDLYALHVDVDLYALHVDVDLHALHVDVDQHALHVHVDLHALHVGVDLHAFHVDLMKIFSILTDKSRNFSLSFNYLPFKFFCPILLDY